MFKSILILIYFLNFNSLHAGIKNDDTKKWWEITDSFLIDTKSFNIEPPLMYFWVKNPNYSKRRLIINCSTLEEMERYKQEKTEWRQVIFRSEKYKIVNQLCFLTSKENFKKERIAPKWAKKIIANSKKNISAESLKDEKSNQKKSQTFLD